MRAVFIGMGFADIVKERSGPEFSVIRIASREIEDLKRVVERIAFGVVAHVLCDAVEGVEHVQKFGVEHLSERVG